MEMNRRKFLGSTGGAGALLGFLGLDAGRSAARAEELAAKLNAGRITTTICPYCAVGCGALVVSEKTDDDRWHVEGDPEHPINEGTLCPKGASLYQLANNEKRLTKALHRAPGADKFTEMEPEEAAKKIAARIKTTRDETFTEKNDAGDVVNRTTAIASLGSAALDNEECWLYQKMLRGLGLVYIEHQARI